MHARQHRRTCASATAVGGGGGGAGEWRKEKQQTETDPIFMFGKQISMYPVIHGSVSSSRAYLGITESAASPMNRSLRLFVYLTKWFKCLHCAPQLEIISMAHVDDVMPGKHFAK